MVEGIMLLLRILAGMTLILIMERGFAYVHAWRIRRANGLRGPPPISISLAAREQAGMSLQKIIVAILLAFIGVIFIINVTPTMESNISSANITNTFTAAMVDMFAWLIPVGGLIGIAYGVFRLFGGGGKGE